MTGFLLLILSLVFDESLQSSGGPLSKNQRAFETANMRLVLKVDPEREEISGYSETQFRILQPGLAVLELELATSLIVSKVSSLGNDLVFTRNGVQLLIQLPEKDLQGISIRVDYAGKPPVATRPPWDGGFNWSRTDSGKAWVGVSCQGPGGKVWFPCKSHPSDKIEGISLEITIPESLYCAANGRLTRIDSSIPGFRTFSWEHPQPIATYNVSINLADYEVLQQTYSHQGRSFPLFFFLLKEYQVADQLEDDDRNYQQKKDDLQCLTAEYLTFFEDHFGPYPWDLFKLAHTAYRGMEHQTINSYGEHFRLEDGYDFLLFHEMGHEWWGNKISVADWAHFWIHEGICTYATAVYLEEIKGVKAAEAFFAQSRSYLSNKQPLVPGKDLTSSQVYSNDVYYKGALMLHSLRFLVGKQTLDRILKTFAISEAYSVPNQVQTSDFIQHVNKISGQDLSWFFDVYLFQAALPQLQVKEQDGKLQLNWINQNFPMPIEIKIGMGRKASIQRISMPDGKGSIDLAPGTSWELDPQNMVLRQN